MSIINNANNKLLNLFIILNIVKNTYINAYIVYSTIWELLFLLFPRHPKKGINPLKLDSYKRNNTLNFIVSFLV